jgi:hypothetical protein
VQAVEIAVNFGYKNSKMKIMNKHRHIKVTKSVINMKIWLKRKLCVMSSCLIMLLNTLYAQQIIVWPGDANNDGIVNNLDLLHVGVAFGLQGYSRDSISLEWRQFIVNSWPDLLPNGLNAGYTDCSGNGMVNIDDVFAIEENYGETNSNFNGLQFQTGNINDPKLSIVPDQNVWLPGDTVSVTIILTQSSTDSVYSVAFTLYYDTLLVREFNVSIRPHPQFSGGGTQPVFVQKNYPLQGFIEFAVSRTNKRNHGGNIAVAYASFIIEDNLIGKTFLDVANAFRLDKIRMYDKAMKNIPVMGDTIDAKVSTVIPEQRLKKSIRIYPVPAAHSLIIDYSEDILLQHVLLIDINGKTWLPVCDITARSAMIDVATIPDGIYIMKIIGDKGVLHEKVIVKK